jgi:hypothetical protein
MPTSTNKLISSSAIQRAARMAKESGQNVVVYLGQVGIKDIEICVTAKVWEAAPEKPGVKFLAVIDENGNYVD